MHMFPFVVHQPYCGASQLSKVVSKLNTELGSVLHFIVPAANRQVNWIKFPFPSFLVT